MQRALSLAQTAAEKGEVPVGAVVVQGEKVIGEGYNLTLTHGDPSLHGEVVAIREAARALKSHRLLECDLYVTLEPCTMCAGLISHARLRRVYYGAFDTKGGAVDHGVRFFQAPTCLHAPEVYGGLGEKEAAFLLQDFFQKRR